METEQQTNNTEQISSVETSINAKGQISGKAKIYNNNPDEALKKAQEIIAKIGAMNKEVK